MAIDVLLAHPEIAQAIRGLSALRGGRKQSIDVDFSRLGGGILNHGHMCPDALRCLWSLQIAIGTAKGPVVPGVDPNAVRSALVCRLGDDRLLHAMDVNGFDPSRESKALVRC